MIKILHIADLHIGLEFSRYPTIANQLKQERLNALTLLVNRSNQEGVHAIVVAGDLFEKLTVPQKLVREVKSIFASFTGEVIIIPGNHDWYNDSASENKVWDWFLAEPGNNIHFLNQLKQYSFTLDNRDVIFYPCGCHQKHFEFNRIGWVQKSIKSEESVNIGIAHGNVEGYGLDEEGRYFNMTPMQLSDAGLDCWLLGHIHAPHPNTLTAGHELFFFAGNHCSDKWKTNRSGGAWLVQIAEDKKVNAYRWNNDGICFQERTFTINDESELITAIDELTKMSAQKTVLRLNLRGHLSEKEKSDFENQIVAVTDSFLYKEINQNIKLKITSEDINKLYPVESIPHSLLLELTKNEDDELALQLAYENIKSL